MVFSLLRAAWGAQGLLALWVLFLAAGIIPPQGPLPRMGVLMGAGLGLGKDQGHDEDQEKGT